MFFFFYCIYISFFPQLIAGPIERANKLIPQIKNFPLTTSNQFFIGLNQLLYGFFLKVIVSNNLNNLTSLLLNEDIPQHNSHTLIGLILFYFQIYFDFHGYTNIAIGLANIFGIKLHQNFKLPFIAISLKDFWHRWHISLSTWFRDYLYIPLGGNKSKCKLSIILLVFIISGVWHGPTYNFLFWGIFHGLIFLLEERVRPFLKIPKPFAIITVFSLVSFGWLFFYYDDLISIKSVLYNLFNEPWTNSIYFIKIIILKNKLLLFLLLLTIIFNFFEDFFFKIKSKKIELIINFLIIDVILIMIILFGSLGGKEFIYFRF